MIAGGGTWQEVISVIGGCTLSKVISVKAQVPKSATLMRRAGRHEGNGGHMYSGERFMMGEGSMMVRIQ